MPSPRARRRQRSLRLTVSFLLIVAAVLIVGAGIAYGSDRYLAAAAVLGVVCGAVATRLTYLELSLSRIDAGRGRAELAREFLTLTEAQADENQSFQVAITDRIRRREVAVVELEAALTAAQHRAAEAIRKRNAEAERADLAESMTRAMTLRIEGADEESAEAEVRVSELEDELTQVRAELSSAEVELGSAQSELVMLRAELATTKAELDTAHAEVAAWQSAGPVRKRA